MSAVNRRCGLIGVAPLGTKVNLGMNSILFGRHVRGIIEGDSIPDVFIPQLIELWRQGRFPFDRLIKEYPLEQINQAVRDSERGVVLMGTVSGTEIVPRSSAVSPTNDSHGIGDSLAPPLVTPNLAMKARPRRAGGR